MQSQHVEIVASAVEAVARSLVPSEVHRVAATQRGARLPVRFESIEDEACTPYPAHPEALHTVILFSGGVVHGSLDTTHLQ